jgi:hypothetical protein
VASANRYVSISRPVGLPGKFLDVRTVFHWMPSSSSSTVSSIDGRRRQGFRRLI